MEDRSDQQGRSDHSMDDLLIHHTTASSHALAGLPRRSLARANGKWTADDSHKRQTMRVPEAVSFDREIADVCERLFAWLWATMPIQPCANRLRRTASVRRFAHMLVLAKVTAHRLRKPTPPEAACGVPPHMAMQPTRTTHKETFIFMYRARASLLQQNACPAPRRATAQPASRVKSPEI